MHTLRAFSLFLLTTFAGQGWAAMCGESMITNSCLRADNPIQACRNLVTGNPSNAAARVALCEALALEGKLDEAEVVINQGIARCSGRACQTLKLAMSYLEERRAARNRADPRAAEITRQANRRFCLSPFNNERSVAACEALLLDEPEDSEIYAALIQKLLKMGDASGALAYAIQGRKTLNDDSLFANLVEEAADQRQAVVDDCLNDDSIAKCEQSYLAGADDEYLVLRRQGELLTDAGQYESAEEALDRAAQLRPSDPDIIQALNALNTARNPAPPTVVAQVQQNATAVPETRAPSPIAETAATVGEGESARQGQEPIGLRNLISANGTSL